MKCKGNCGRLVDVFGLNQSTPNILLWLNLLLLACTVRSMKE
jgi:hypothetical protein